MFARSLLCATATLALCASAHGQAAAPADVEEIIVTAQKSEQRLQDVPVTITAYTGRTLRELGITQFDQLSAYVPGVNIQEQSPNNPGFVIRGITSDSGSAQEAPRVTVYYNGIDVSRSRGSYFDLFDIERVEAIKGPQATLFGTAAAIGAISVISRRPDDGLSAEVRAGVGNFAQRRIDAVLNAGSDSFGVRAAMSFKQRDGVVRNIAGDAASQSPGGRRVADLNGQDQLGVRLTASARPTDALEADLILTWDRQRNPGTSFKSGSFPPTGGTTSPYSFAEIAGSPQSRQALGLPEPALERDVWDVNGQLRYDLGGGFSLAAIAGFRSFDSLEVFDADGSQVWYLEFAEDASGQQKSFEGRIAWDGDAGGLPVRAFAGANHFTERGTQRVPFSTEEGTYIACTRTAAFAALQAAIGNPPCVAANGTIPSAGATRLLTGGRFSQLPYSSEFENRGEIRTTSLFVDATVTLFDALDLTAGVRWLTEDRRSKFFARQPNSQILLGLGVRSPLLPTVDTAGQVFRASDDNSAWLPRFNALLRVADDWNLYGTISKGRRSPVVQLTARATATGPAPNRVDIPAETVWNYEGGVKYSAGRASAQLGIFYQTYENFQVQISEGGMLVTRNAGSAKNFGVEFETRVQPVRQVTLFGNFAYIDAGIDDEPGNGIFAGDRFRLQPEWQAAAGGTLTLPLGGSFEGFLTPTVTYRGQLFFEVPNNPLIANDKTTLVNIRGGVRDPDGRWEVLGYVTNLTGKEYLLDAGNTGGAFGYPTFIRGLPRLYGVEATIRF
jgi:outer membrane receptor protein involved in Fe transport